ncbi:hypothetical protein H6G75_15960 [Nostoc sp. FACHB-280]|nr:hypothetical protein [Nostoc sp. FACHB-280]
MNEEVIEQWHNQQKTGRKGASNYYSDTAIATMGTIFYGVSFTRATSRGVFRIAVHAHGN